MFFTLEIAEAGGAGGEHSSGTFFCNYSMDV
jgi:hypothetical protein